MPTHGRPKPRLGRLPRVFICVGAVVALVSGGFMADHFVAEHRWQIYRGEAQENGLSLKLPDPDAPLPKGDNLAAETPFAPVKVGADGKPIQPATLKNDLLPAEYLADLSRGKIADLTASGPQLQRCSNLDGSSGSDRDYATALLAACDRQMGANWARVLAAEARPEAQFNIRYWPMPMMEKVPVADFRIAAQTHALRATALLHLGRSREAAEEVQGCLRLVEALDADPSLAIFMLRTVLLTMPLNAVWEGMNIGAWTDADLVALDAMFSQIHLGMGYAKAIETERGWINSVCNELAADPSQAKSDVMKEWVASLNTPVSFPGVMNWKRATVRKNQLILNQHYEAIQERIDAAGNWHGRELPLNAVTAKSWRLAGLAMVDFSKTEGRVLAVEARLRQARLAIGLERYRRKVGNLPSSLEALVPDYLPEVLEDPIDGAAMRYSRDASRAFRLWSIGDDHEDDQGVADTEMCRMTFDTVWPGTVPGKKSKTQAPPDRGPRALRSITSSYSMAW